uniref:Ig-like domain-containing protein n=1 Tax=Gouania willdenowi TaxID=441366 RepID=A0A8C5GKT9_GOUWI
LSDVTSLGQKVQTVISVSQTWLTPGASINLTCSINYLSSGWKFYWFRAVRLLSENNVAYSYKRLPGSTEPTQQNTFVVHGQEHTEGYACSAVRGEADVRDYSGTQTYPHPSVSLTVHPNRVQHFRIDPVSISCEGFSTQWRLMRCNVHTKVCRVVGNTMNSIFKLDENDLGIEGVYWCESDIAFSNAVNVTGRDDIILLSPAVPVLEGEKVILGCRTKLPIPRINFYKDHKVIFSVAVTKPREANMVISAISKSDKGFYKCGDAQTVSLQSWVSVTGTDHLIVCYCVLSIGFIHPKNMKHGIDWIV